MSRKKPEYKTKVEIEKELQEGIEKYLKNGGEIEYV